MGTWAPNDGDRPSRAAASGKGEVNLALGGVGGKARKGVKSRFWL
jgi:hypothetical protein